VIYVPLGADTWSTSSKGALFAESGAILIDISASMHDWQPAASPNCHEYQMINNWDGIWLSWVFYVIAPVS
jgi:hypothetical protein